MISERQRFIAELISDNEVDSEKLAADLALEKSRKELVQAKAENDRVLAIAVQAERGLATCNEQLVPS